MAKSKQNEDIDFDNEERVTRDYAVTNHAVGARGFTAGPRGADQVLVPARGTIKVSLTDAEHERMSKHPDLHFGPVDLDEEGSLKPVLSKD